MALNLNQKNEFRQVDEHQVPLFREFYGRNVDQMPLLIASGRTPISVARVLQRRLDLRAGSQDVKSAWRDNYFDTIDAIIYHPEGEVVIALDSQDLRAVTPKSLRDCGALVLGENKDEAFANYETLKKQPNVIVFKKGEIGKVNNGLLREEVKAHPFWKAIARSQTLLNDAVDYTFEEYQARFAKDTKIEDVRIMGVYPYGCQGDSPEMRALCVGGLGNRSGVDGRNDLGSSDGRLVGELAPEAQVAQNSGVSPIQVYTMADVQKANKQLEAISQVVRAENLSDVTSLVEKL